MPRQYFVAPAKLAPPPCAFATTGLVPLLGHQLAQQLAKPFDLPELLPAERLAPPGVEHPRDLVEVRPDPFDLPELLDPEAAGRHHSKAVRSARRRSSASSSSRSEVTAALVLGQRPAAHPRMAVTDYVRRRACFLLSRFLAFSRRRAVNPPAANGRPPLQHDRAVSAGQSVEACGRGPRDGSARPGLVEVSTARFGEP